MPLTDTTREEIARAIDPMDWIAIDGWAKYAGTANYDDRISDIRNASLDRATAIEPIINRLIAEARDKALDEAAAVCRGEHRPQPGGGIFLHWVRFPWMKADEYVRSYSPYACTAANLAKCIRALKTKDNPHG